MQDEIPDYDSQNFLINEGHEDLLERKIIARNIGEGEIGVDLGGGYGRLTELMIEHFKTVILMDYSVKNLYRAKKALQGKNVIFVRCDIRDPPLEAGSVDGAISIRVMHHYSKLEFITNLCTKLNGNGTLIFNVNNSRSPLFILNIMKSLIFEGKRINFLVKGLQKICYDSKGGCIYFIDYRDVLSFLQNDSYTYRTIGAGILHNGFIERNSSLIDVKRLTEAELSGIFAGLPAILFPDVFFIVKSKRQDNRKKNLDPFSAIKCKRCSSHLSREGKAVVCSGCGEQYGNADDLLDLL
ncbi:MAG: class I SAM-dependent methyltransferase [Thermoplasmatales archaeon]